MKQETLLSTRSISTKAKDKLLVNFAVKQLVARCISSLKADSAWENDEKWRWREQNPVSKF